MLAAPVIWLGSWLFSLMAGSGCAVFARLSQLEVRKIKRGPRGPMHTARMWMALAIPGGAPGYDDDKKFGNFVTHIAAQTSQRLREHSDEPRKVKGSRRCARFWEISGVPGVRREQKCCFQLCARTLRVIPGPATSRGSGISRFRVRSLHERPGMTV